MNLWFFFLTIFFQGHAIALEYERLLTREDVASTSSGRVAPKRPICNNIADAMHRQAREGYRKLLVTAYNLAVDGLPFNRFKTLVRVQKQNGVKLVKGTESSNRARELVGYIAETERTKLSSILAQSTAFSILTDGSQVCILHKCFSMSLSVNDIHCNKVTLKANIITSAKSNFVNLLHCNKYYDQSLNL